MSGDIIIRKPLYGCFSSRKFVLNNDVYNQVFPSLLMTRAILGLGFKLACYDNILSNIGSEKFYAEKYL